MLERFRTAQRPRISRLEAMRDAKAMPPPLAGERPAFSARLKRGEPIALIAEYKRASPSRGSINLAASPEDIAAAYAAAGASAISVLTEEEYFQGHPSYIGRMAGPGLPLLRKDFLIHPLQVLETAATPASALLLIARMLDEGTFIRMLEMAAGAGLETVLEIFDEEDLQKVRRVLAVAPAAPVIIQVNNRDLRTLRVSDAPSRALIPRKKAGEIWISASGINTGEQVLERAALGFDAVLVGSSLMECGDPGAALAGLCGRGAA